MPETDVQIGQWHIRAWDYDIERDHHCVAVSGPDQEFDIDNNGIITIDSTSGEIGRGYSGDCASSRYIPSDVMARAIQMWTEIGGVAKVTV